MKTTTNVRVYIAHKKPFIVIKIHSFNNTLTRSSIEGTSTVIFTVYQQIYFGPVGQ
jgi:hypothetical protein